MKILGFATRRNLKYPLIFLIIILLRKLNDILLENFSKIKIIFISPILIFISQLGAGLIKFFLSKKPKKDQKQITNKKSRTIELIENKKIILSSDGARKITILIIFASYFNWIGVIIRNNINFVKNKSNRNIDSFIEYRLRNIQILISALLCFSTLRIKIYAHQKISLMVVGLFLIGIIIIEFLKLLPNGDYNKKIKDIILSSFSYLARSFLDTIEKYLFEYNYADPFRLLMFEGLICLIFSLIYFIFNYNDYKIEISDLYLENDDKYSKEFYIFLYILLLLLYTILSGFRNIYRLYTNKLYSPTTRALAEAILDPFFVIYSSMPYFKDYLKPLIIIIILLFIIGFFSLVYNDFIILYCFGLEENTYKEITKRALSQDKDLRIMDEDFEDDDDDFLEKERNITEVEQNNKNTSN